MTNIIAIPVARNVPEKMTVSTGEPNDSFDDQSNIDIESGGLITDEYSSENPTTTPNGSGESQEPSEPLEDEYDNKNENQSDESHSETNKSDDWTVGNTEISEDKSNDESRNQTEEPTTTAKYGDEEYDESSENISNEENITEAQKK